MHRSGISPSVAHLALRDDRGRLFRFSQFPSRVVSLVPSDTYTFVQLGGGPQLIARTDYCVEPQPFVAGLPSIGGTKSASVAAILEFEPDLVLANQEENTEEVVRELEARGTRVFVTFPKTVSAGVALIARLARLVDPASARTVAVDTRTVVQRAYAAHRAAVANATAPLRAFIPIWMDPLMTVSGDTYISDMLRLAGFTNVFLDRERRYPLAADLDANAKAKSAPGRDTRYPRIRLNEVVERRPNVILLPDEPYAFGEVEAASFRSLPLDPAPQVHLVAGRDLMWPGLKSIEGLTLLQSRADAWAKEVRSASE